jgi:hypothetical protein
MFISNNSFIMKIIQTRIANPNRAILLKLKTRLI